MLMPMVELRTLHGTTQILEADRLLRRVWNTKAGEDPPLAVDLMCAFAHTGGYVGGALLDGVLVGVASGFLAAGGGLHSHVAGVAPEMQGRGIGQAIKAHQRSWAASRGLTFVSWTFDPLVRRNAHLNLTRLGARVSQYVPDFYGPLTDGINDGDASDRLFVHWPVSPVAAAPLPLDPPVVIVSSAGVVRPPDGAAVLHCGTPSDISHLRREDPAEARRWRAVVRDALGGALASGYRISAFTKDGFYVLERAA
ncbi:GNAT family N-acetyltransferase [Nonomuraea sp. NPDC050556]|uniref:GNAT family N-acetyltransferase n=1 Tax=Nonomuraea sp. NPDC050556 TaxID=3364369 RepID=UPI0037A8D504